MRGRLYALVGGLIVGGSVGIHDNVIGPCVMALGVLIIIRGRLDVSL